MCLSSLEKFKLENDDGWVKGWKVLRVYSDRHKYYMTSEYGWMYYNSGNNDRKCAYGELETWSQMPTKYPVGIHVYLDRRICLSSTDSSTDSFVKVPVYFKPSSVLTTGYDKGSRVVVVRRVYIYPRNYRGAIARAKRSGLKIKKGI